MTAGTVTPRPLDEAKVEAFAGRLLELYTGGMLTFLVDIGHRTGLFAALAAGPATSAALAGRADLQERYVREWLGAMASGGIVGYDPATVSFSLPDEHAACLTGAGSANLAPLSRLDTHLAEHVDAVARAFREGGGVPYAAYRPEFTDVMDALSRGVFDELLVDAYLRLVPGLAGRLAAGARVADVGCGTGHAMVLLAAAFPASSFTGYDLAPDAIARARSEAAGLPNARFEVRDAARPRSRSRWTWCSPSTPSTTRPTRRPCSSGSTPPWCPAATSSWSSRAPPALWPTTWATPWPRSCTGSAPCTA